MIKEHTVRIYPAPRGLHAAHCTCSAGSPLFNTRSQAEYWAEDHVRPHNGTIVEPKRVEK